MMRPTSRAVVFVPLAAILALVACSKPDSAAPPDGSATAAPSSSPGAHKPPPPPPPSMSATPLAQPLTVTIQDKPHTLTNGLAQWMNGAWLVVRLSDAPLDCAHANTATVSVSVSSGPDQKFFVGSEVPAQIDFPASYDNGFVTMKHVGSKAGEDVEGSFRYDDVTPKGVHTSAAGEFRVHLCENAPPLPNTPSAVKHEDPSGTLAGKPWVAHSAVAYAVDGHRGKYVDRVYFYAEPQATCSWLVQERDSLDLDVEEAKEDSVGHPRPVAALHHRAAPDGGHAPPTVTVGKVGWIRFDKLSFAKGSTLTGVVSLDAPKTAGGEPGDHLEGAFNAILCP